MIAFLAGLLGVCTVQSSVVPHLGIRGIAPDFFLVLTLATAVTVAPELATVMGFLSGLFQDALSGGPLGLHAFSLSLVAFLASRASLHLEADRLHGRFVLLLAGGILSGLVSLAAWTFFLGPRPILPALEAVVVPEAFYTALSGMLVLALPGLAHRLTERWS